MAGRNKKTSFDFFRIYTGFFSNKKIKSLRRAHGAVGIATYLYLLDYIYGNDGYYLEFNDINELSEDIAESICSEAEPLAKVARKVTAVIYSLSDIGLIDKYYLERRIITGLRIQELYIDLSTSCKRIGTIGDYKLIDVPVSPILKNPISSEEMPISSEEMPINSEEITTNIIKDNLIKDKEIEESKKVSNKKEIINQSSACACACESYDDILKDFGVQGQYKEAVIEFIKHLKANKVLMINSRLETLIVRLDMAHSNDKDKIKEIRDAIACGYKRLPCEEN